MIMKKQTKQTLALKTGKAPTQKTGKALPKDVEAASLPEWTGWRGRRYQDNFESRPPSAEFVATLAARLMKDNDLEGAVERAMTLYSNAVEITTHVAVIQGVEVPERIFTFRDAVLEITGTTGHVGRNTANLYEMLENPKWTELKTESQRKEAVSDWANTNEHKRFTQREVAELKRKYRLFKKNKLTESNAKRRGTPANPKS
jgi:hypothetical protein